MNERLYDHVLGSLVGAAIGDALGAPAEGLSKDEIAAKYGGRVETFVDGSDNFYSHGNDVGEITDDSSQMYEMAKAVADCDGVLTVEAAAEALVRWSASYPKYYPRNAGATTSHVIEELQVGADPIELGMLGGYVGRGTTNGAAMRVAGAGLTRAGDWDRAVENAVTMCRPSHGTQHAFAGAAAIAAGISEGLREDASTVSVVRACVFGARRGEELGLATARKAEGIRVPNTLGLALREALLAHDMEDAEDRLDETVGADGSIQSAVALAVGLFLASDGDPHEAIASCVNIGGDADTTACIAGSLVGAFRGCSAFPTEWVDTVRAVNPELKLDELAARLTTICEASA